MTDRLTDKTSDTDLHDLALPTLPEWGPGVPGTPVEVIYWDGTLRLAYGWRDGRSTIANPDRERRTSPDPWGRCRITAVLADDPTRWEPVDARERVKLSQHLVGARVCGGRNGATITGVAEEVDYDGWLWGKDALLLATEHDSLRVHPADLAAAREAAAPKPPTCWDEWESGDVWAWGDVVYRMGDDRVLRLATRDGTWADAAPQPGGAWLTATLTPPTAENMARVAAADEAARLPEEPPVGSVALDRDGDALLRTVDGWMNARSGWCWEWAALHERRGPMTVIHRAEP